MRWKIGFCSVNIFGTIHVPDWPYTSYHFPREPSENLTMTTEQILFGERKYILAFNDLSSWTIALYSNSCSTFKPPSQCCIFEATKQSCGRTSLPTYKRLPANARYWVVSELSASDDGFFRRYYELGIAFICFLWSSITISMCPYSFCTRLQPRNLSLGSAPIFLVGNRALRFYKNFHY